MTTELTNGSSEKTNGDFKAITKHDKEEDPKSELIGEKGGEASVTFMDVEYLDDGYDSYSVGSACALSIETMAEGISHAMSHWKILVFGQALSLALSASGASATDMVNRCNLNAPTFQFSLVYLALSFHLIYLLIMHYFFKRTAVSTGFYFPGTSLPLSAPWWFYFVLAILNVEANFFTILAFRYTTLTSITLFDSLAIPAAMFTSKQLLGCRYYPSHMMGASICFIGVVMNVCVDFSVEEEDYVENEHRMLGDVLAMAGGILYGVNDTLMELMVKKYCQTEFLGLLGFYGTLISIVQILFLEMDEVFSFLNNDCEDCCSMTVSLGLLTIFFIAEYCNNVGRAKFLCYSEAALLNLSLLTADLYAVLFSVFVELIYPNPVFYVALVLIVSGVIIYEIGPSPMVNVQNITVGNRRIVQPVNTNELEDDDFELPQNDTIIT